MSRRLLACVGLLAFAVVSFAPDIADAQTPPVQPRAAAPAGTTKAPRTSWGDPDLQGFWATPSSVATPLERPESVSGRTELTEEERAAREEWVRNRRDTSAQVSRFNPRADPVGNYNDFWTPEEARMSSRTSLIVDPADGRVPPLTPEAQKRADEQAAARRARGPADNPEDLGVWSRCIARVGAPIVPGPYNNNYQIVQSPGWVVIAAEVIDTRVIPLDGRPHLPSTMRAWLGDSRGRWEGDTLVVETTNFSQNVNFRGAGPNMKLIERFTRTSPTTIEYEFTVEDPTTFTKPWTAINTMSTLDGALYEYACHEGNSSMLQSLTGARAEEKAAAEKAAGEAGTPR
jgi:hypothetical protein